MFLPSVFDQLFLVHLIYILTGNFDFNSVSISFELCHKHKRPVFYFPSPLVGGKTGRERDQIIRFKQTKISFSSPLLSCEEACKCKKSEKKLIKEEERGIRHFIHADARGLIMSPAPPPTSPFFLDTLFDLITVLLITAILLLSLLSLAFIFHLRFKTHSSPHLHNFNALWSLRLLLVLSVILWSVSYLLRSSLFLQRLRLFSLSQGIFLCKLHVVLTLGLFQPAFLTTLLFLLNLSIQKRDPTRTFTNIAHIFILCLPVLLFQIFVVFYAPTTPDILPDFFRRDYVVHKELASGDESAVCAYPLLSTIVFSVFAFSFLVGFVLSCWRVISVVINKRLRIRIYTLGSTTVAALVSQVAFMALSVMWLPEKVAFGGAALMVFLAGLSCVVVGEGVLVIHPISDALFAGCDHVCVLTLGESVTSSTASSSS